MKTRSLLVFCALVGCSETTQVNITKSVGAAGGTVSGSDGTSLTVPMGALTQASNITISSVTVAAPAGTVLVGPAYDFGPEGTNFAQPVSITLPFDSSKIPAGRTSADIRIYTAPRGSTTYTTLATSVSGNTVVASTSHFTVYLPAAPSAAVQTDLGGGGNCTPSCTASGNSCGCAATCGGTSYVLTCSQSSTSGPASCSCTANGSPIGTSIVLDNCSATQAQSAFQTQCLPN